MGQLLKPEEIEARSFEIIREELGSRLTPGPEQPVVLRVIHTTADLEFADLLHFTPGAVQAALSALGQGVDIVCDTNMIKAGVNKTALSALGGKIHCFMADPDVAAEAKLRGVTRAWVSMERAAALDKPCIVAVGNAPTALLRLAQLIGQGRISPRLVIAAPVGFVNVVESKEPYLDGPIPAIVTKGRKGGSTVAAAICNALLYTAVPMFSQTSNRR